MSTTDKATLREVRQALRKCGYGHWAVEREYWDRDGIPARLAIEFFDDLNAIHQLIDVACRKFKCGCKWLRDPKGLHLVRFFGADNSVTHVDFATAVIRAINQIPEVEG